MTRRLDALAKALATGVPRRKALKMFAAGLLGVTAGSKVEEAVTPPAAEASPAHFLNNYTGVIWRPIVPDITVGAPLTFLQLDAVAFVQGIPIPYESLEYINATRVNGVPLRPNYYYTPGLGTYLPSGYHQLMVQTIPGPRPYLGYIPPLTGYTTIRVS